MPATAFSIGWVTRWYGAAGRGTWFTRATISWPSCRRLGRIASHCAAKFIADRRGVLSMPGRGAANIQCYPVLDRANATLTVREKEADPRVPLPGSEWELAKAKDTGRQSETHSVEYGCIR